MKSRKTWIIAFAIIIIGVFGYKYISGLKKAPTRKANIKNTVAQIITVKNKNLPLIIEGSGQIQAKNKIEIFAEVNGVLNTTKKEFRTAQKYKKGDLLISINDKEFKASLMAQRSDFQSLIASILSDIKLEFPEEQKKWDNYLNSIIIGNLIPELPKITSKKEKFFLAGRKIFASYYNIKNLEARLYKYNLFAPFDGIVTETNINPGGLVRSGQKLGTFINTNIFELSLAVPASDAVLVHVGDKVEILSHDNAMKWDGVVSRINSAININTQTVAIFIETKGDGIKEGMFPTAEIYSGTIDNAYEISRNLIFDNSWIYYVSKDSTLQKIDIQPIRYLNSTVVVKGLPNGMNILNKNIPGSFVGLKVVPLFTL